MSFTAATATASANPWLRILGALEKKISRNSYDTWLKPTRFSHANGNVLFVRVPTAEFRHIGEKFGDLIQEAMDTLEPAYQDVKFITAEEDPTAPPVRPDGGFAPVSATSAPANAVRQQRFDWDSAAQLSPKYTFGAFVIGAGNQFAHAAAQAVAERPSKAYNPLFLYGGVGMGKTHLMQAIGHEVKRRQPQASICYISSEKFTNEMINSLRYDRMISFRDKFRNVDVLLIDDIQFLAGKERIQEEFFHTFNALHESRKQIVLTCDRPASEIANLEHRLVSRFEWGLVTDLQPPDVEMRLAILHKKAKVMGVELPAEILDFLANRIRTNIRRLEGALIRVASYAGLTGQKLSLEVVETLLREVLHEEGRFSINIELIQKRVAEHFDIRLADMTSKRRPENIAFPRQIAMFLARQMTESSLNTIGEAFGGRDHGTVLHACRLVKDRMEIDSNVRQVVHYLEKQLQR